MKKLLIVLSMLLLGTALFAGCSGSGSQTTQTADGQQTTDGMKVFTVDELAKFDGKNGNPAYVAVDGVVYDVTAGPNWPEGMHTPCGTDAYAGIDLSEVIKMAPPRMRANLESFPIVGKMAQ
jgi:predicted heme/steroid binding protein